MTSFVVSSQDENKRRDFIMAMCSERGIDQFDITILQKAVDEDKKKAKSSVSESIGIQDVRLLQKKLFLKPLKSKEKAIVLENADTLTIEAQNALLKVLEEPPSNTLIILSSGTKDVFLPTVLSRCKIIELQEKQNDLKKDESNDLEELIQSIDTLTNSQALENAEKISKSKESALSWLQKATYITHKGLLKDAKTHAKILKILHKTHKTIKTTNANPRLTLENMFLALAKNEA